MAVTLTQQPTTPNAAYTNLLYVVSGSTTTNQPQYSYVMDIYESGSSTLLNRVTQKPNPAGVGVFDPSRFLQSQLDYDGNWKTNGKARFVNAVGDFTIKFGEQYGTSISSSITVYENLTSHELRVFPGIVDPNNGSSFNFDSSSYLNQDRNPYLTNYPGATAPASPIPRPDGYPYLVDSKDYLTITEFQDTFAPTRTTVNGYHVENGVFHAPIFEVSLPNPNPSSSAEDLQFLTAGVGPKNLSEFSSIASASIASGEVNMLYTTRDGGGIIALINDHWDGVSGPSGSTLQGLTDFQKTIQPQGTEYTRFAFINNYGFYDYYNVYSPIRRNSTVDKQNVSLPKVDYSNLTSVYSQDSRGETTYYSDNTDTYSITTQWLDKEIANWLEELLTSPEVFIQQGTDYVPVVITNVQFQNNESTARNKTFQYTIDFKPANGRDLVSSVADCPKPYPYPYQTTNVDFIVSSSLGAGDVYNVGGSLFNENNTLSFFLGAFNPPTIESSSKQLVSGSMSNLYLQQTNVFMSSSVTSSFTVSRDIYVNDVLLETTSSNWTNVSGSGNIVLGSSSLFQAYNSDVKIDINFVPYP